MPARILTGRRSSLVRLWVAGLVTLLAAGCGGDDEGERSRQDGGAVTGQADLRFSGAVTGTFDAPTEVACFGPSATGDRFTVSVDAEPGIEVGGRRFEALDLSTPPYEGPRSYDVGEALEGDDFEADDFLLLFEEFETDPFRWGDEGTRASGTVTIDAGGESGTVALQGWENSARDRVDLEGTFRCGRQPAR